MAKATAKLVSKAPRQTALTAVVKRASGFPVFDDRGRTVVWMTRTVHRQYDVEAQKILDKENISIAHWYYLRVLAERGELNQLELSRRVGIASTTAVPALDSMESRGLLKRTRNPKDRRKYYVSLTDEGRRLVEKLLPEIVDMITTSLEGISRDELRAFWSVLHKMENKLAQVANDSATID
jgi:MarR family transcriptional regulator, organic hydroperoxide resistance regulator